MSPSGRAACAAALAVILAAPAIAQSQPGSRPDQPLTLPVSDLELPVSSLDGNVSVSARGVVLQSDVLFSFGKAMLGRRARARVDQAVAEVRRRKPALVRVVGYTDSKGSPGYNRKLSLRRASAVARELRRALGDGAPPLRTAGRGEADPVAGNTTGSGADDPRGRARNRRVELTFG